MSEKLPSAMDYNEHEKTYKFFIGLTKWSTIALVLLMIIMAATLV
ncbi:aa3-type cytochrome c oxidase subunit IV [Coralliovum pocilloporae]